VCQVCAKSCRSNVALSFSAAARACSALFSGSAIPFTVSIGVATRAPGERDLEAIMKRADQALYKAKGNGRNRVEVA